MRTFKSTYFDLFFINFPIWIGISYLLVNSFVSGYRELIFLIFLILFGESHFAATWLFYLDKKNKHWLSQHRVTMYYLPIFLVSIYIAVGLKSIFAAIMLGNIFSLFHVSRQSVGVLRLYDYVAKKNNKYEYYIYIFSALFLFIGFLKFLYNDIILSLGLNLPEYKNNLYFNLLLAVLVVLISIDKTKGYKINLTKITGTMMYAPYAFCPNVYDATVIGVGMHWCQYLALNYKIYIHNSKNFFNTFLLLFFILIYTVPMSLMGYKSNINIMEALELIILIPLTGQFLHYYIDSFIWKFSDNHLRENIAKKIL